MSAIFAGAKVFMEKRKGHVVAQGANSWTRGLFAVILNVNTASGLLPYQRFECF